MASPLAYVCSLDASIAGDRFELLLDLKTDPTNITLSLNGACINTFMWYEYQIRQITFEVDVYLYNIEIGRDFNMIGKTPDPDVNIKISKPFRDVTQNLPLDQYEFNGSYPSMMFLRKERLSITAGEVRDIAASGSAGRTIDEVVMPHGLPFTPFCIGYLISATNNWALDIRKEILPVAVGTI